MHVPHATLKPGTILTYMASTGHGSHLQLICKFISRRNDETLGQTLYEGDIIVRGTAKSTGTEISFCGFGHMPEVGCRVVVAEHPASDDDDDENGLPDHDYEEIRTLKLISREEPKRQ